MAIDLNDEIVQDFLTEAGEILEQLNSQLVDLEQRPGDKDLLNSVFRSFHTVKGGAGFLALNNLVEVCHKAEDIFNLLRQGERRVDAELMDYVLPVLDTVNSMFDEIRGGEEPGPADADLLAALAVLAAGGSPSQAAAEVAHPETQAETSAESQTPPDEEISDQEFQQLLDAVSGPAPDAAAPSRTAAAQGDHDITEEEFEALLDQLQGQSKHSGAPKTPSEQAPAASESAATSDDITEEEFEALLDKLQADGKSAGASKKEPAQKSTPAAAKATQESAAAAKSAPAGDDDITEDEFEALLDKLHGTGKKDGVPSTKSADSANAAAAPVGQKAAAKPEQKQPAAETTVRVETSVLDRIMNMVGELVLVRNRLATLEAAIGDEDVSKTISTLDVVTSDLQTAAMKTRMQPIKKVFGRFPRVVRDLARSLNKEIKLEMMGEETDLDKNLVEALADPLVHLVRNSVDHGIEMPDDRVNAGKPRAGTVCLSAQQEGDHILLSIYDDGRGMDPDVLRRKAVEKGVMDQDAAARLDDKDCFELIFAPGFSTKTEISDVSGRGVGMDVVKTRINQLNGVIEIDSTPGRGTRIDIKVPLTLAIVPTLMVTLGRQVFALPLVNVDEILDVDMGLTKVVDGQKTLVVRGKALPLFYLSEWLVNGCMGYERGHGHVVIVSVGTIKVGLLVDHLVGQEEVVIKPLGAFLHGTRGLAGATITGDGHIALILDLPGLIGAYARRY
jgi:two-component system chemotaxis sensor kinase CheA